MKTETLETISRIRESAKHLPEPRVVSLQIGEVARQGDIYVQRVKTIEGMGEELKSRQLAPGSTKGSRHIVDESPSVKIFQSAPSLKAHARFQVGPAIEALADFSITHPEHAWIKIAVKAKQFFQVWFQADFARKERAQD